VLVLSNEEIESLLTISDCIEVLEDAYRALAVQDAVNIPRLDCLIEHRPDSGTVYSFKTMGGVIRGGVQALRINSDVVHWPSLEGTRRRVKIPAAGGRFVGLIYLYDPETGMPLAMMPDGVIQHLRVGATNGLAAKYLAPKNAATVALLGTGWQAEAQLQAIAETVRPERFQVYSPNAERRLDFCKRMEQIVSAAVIPLTSPEAAVLGANVVLSATNAMSPTLDARWLRPGTHFSTIKAQEVDAKFLSQTKVYLHTRQQRKANVIATNNVPQYETERGWWHGDDVERYPDLIDVITSRHPGRIHEDDTTTFVNNVGMGLQFAAVGALVLARAKAQGLGHVLPDEWFTESVHP